MLRCRSLYSNETSAVIFMLLSNRLLFLSVGVEKVMQRRKGWTCIFVRFKHQHVFWSCKTHFKFAECFWLLTYSKLIELTLITSNTPARSHQFKAGIGYKYHNTLSTSCWELFDPSSQNANLIQITKRLLGCNIWSAVVFKLLDVY